MGHPVFGGATGEMRGFLDSLRSLGMTLQKAEGQQRTSYNEIGMATTKVSEVDQEVCDGNEKVSDHDEDVCTG